MRVTVQVSIQADDGADVVVHEVLDVQRDGDFDLDRLGLHLAEAKELLAGLQTVMTTGQAVSAIDRRSRCVGCGRRFAHKDRRTVTVRTVFGAVTLPSPTLATLPVRHASGVVQPVAGTARRSGDPGTARVGSTFRWARLLRVDDRDPR